MAIETPEVGESGMLPDGVQIRPLNTKAILDEVERFYQEKKQDRKPYEFDWFLNFAAVRNGGDGRFNPATANLEPAFTKEDPPHRKRYRINRLRVKYLAKVAKYVNPRQRISVIAANQSREAILNARMTEMVLRYLHRKLNLEAKYELVVAHAELTGKAFWAIRWNPDIAGRFRDPFTGEVVNIKDGDVDVEVVDAFSILVDDLGIETLGRQPRIMRVAVERVSEAEARHPEFAGKFIADAGPEDVFQLQRQIAELGAKWAVGTHSLINAGGSGGRRGDRKEQHQFVLRKEMFWAPSRDFPRGRYALVIGRQLVRFRDELPYEFWEDDFRDNPYPFVEFAATISPGQFYPSTMVEQLRPIAEIINIMKSRVMEHLTSNGMFGKLLIPRRARVSTQAWTSEPNEKIYYDFIPGMMPPHHVEPPRMSPEVWRILDQALRDFDDVSNISQATLGMTAVGVESGYQASLLQEANDAIFAPDRNRMQRSLQEAYLKIRKVISIGYVDQRLFMVGGRGMLPEVFEFSQANIDPHAEIDVQVGSALPEGKAQRLQSLMELYQSGLLGDSQNPRVRRAALDEVDLGGIEREVDPDFQHIERVRRENMKLSRGEPVEDPMPWHKHQIDIAYHEDFLNSPEWETLPPPAKAQFLRHYVLHLKVTDPIRGLEVVGIFAPQFPELAPLGAQLNQIILMSQQPALGAPGAVPGQPQQGQLPFEASPEQGAPPSSIAA